MASFLVSVALPAWGKHCTEWKAIQRLFKLDSSMAEVSGLARSTITAGDFYHVQDSGSVPEIIITDRTGKAVTKRIEEVAFVDAEDLAQGECEKNVPCLVVADIGDNKQRRPHVQLVVVEERALYKSAPLVPRRIILAKYPDGPQNAEALAVHPNGDLFLFTKRYPKKHNLVSTRIYRLSSEIWKAKGPTSEIHGLQTVMELEFPIKGGPLKKEDSALTSADISSDGKRTLFLTSQMAVELDLDLSQGKWEGGEVRRLISPRQPQQEAIVYDLEGRGFYYSSEIGDESKTEGKAALLYIQCD